MTTLTATAPHQAPSGPHSAVELDAIKAKQQAMWESDWMITTVVDTRDDWPAVWRAVSCHRSQVSAYERLHDLPPAHHEALWGRQSFCRVFSRVNGGRTREADLFDGLP